MSTENLISIIVFLLVVIVALAIYNHSIKKDAIADRNRYSNYLKEDKYLIDQAKDNCNKTIEAINSIDALFTKLINNNESFKKDIRNIFDEKFAIEKNNLNLIEDIKEKDKSDKEYRKHLLQTNSDNIFEVKYLLQKHSENFDKVKEDIEKLKIANETISYLSQNMYNFTKYIEATIDMNNNRAKKRIKGCHANKRHIRHRRNKHFKD